MYPQFHSNLLALKGQEEVSHTVYLQFPGSNVPTLIEFWDIDECELAGGECRQNSVREARKGFEHGKRSAVGLA